MAGKSLKAVPKAAVAGLDDSQRSKGPQREEHQRYKNRKSERKKARQRMLMVEAMDIASNYDITISKNNSVVDVLQTLLDRLMDKWKVVCMEVDRLPREEWLVEKKDAEGNTLVEPNVWLQYEAALRGELMDLSIRMGHLGVDERRVRVQEAQIELLGRAVLSAAQNIGLDAPVVKMLGAALRTELQEMETVQDNTDPLAGRHERSNDRHPEVGDEEIVDAEVVG